MTTSNQKHHRRKGVILIIIAPLFLLTSSVVNNFLSMYLEPLGSKTYSTISRKKDNSIDIYIPGAGFSGFFYTLGRLQALHTSTLNSSSFQYYCFSAGCLALLTSLLQLPVDSAVELAHSSRNRWITGEISRFDVVEYFIDGLLLFDSKGKYGSLNGTLNATIDRGAPVECTEFQSNSTHGREKKIDTPTAQLTLTRQQNGIDIRDFLPRINVITSTWNKLNLQSNVQQPSSVEDLKKLLIETTWM